MTSESDPGPSPADPPQVTRRHQTLPAGSAVPVCGRGHPETAPIFKDVPIWNFHGAKDEVEPIASSRAMIDALRKAGGQPRHTEYADRDHSVFAWAYTEPALIEWLFAQRLRPRS